MEILGLNTPTTMDINNNIIQTEAQPINAEEPQIQPQDPTKQIKSKTQVFFNKIKTAPMGLVNKQPSTKKAQQSQAQKE